MASMMVLLGGLTMLKGLFSRRDALKGFPRRIVVTGDDGWCDVMIKVSICCGAVQKKAKMQKIFLDGLKNIISCVLW